MQDDSRKFHNARLASGELVSFSVDGGRFGAIAPMAVSDTTPPGSTDLGGALVVPAFVEGHAHLDISFFGDAWQPHRPCTDGFDVRERVAFQMEGIARAAPIRERARTQLELCLANGSTRMRSHVMVSAEVGLSHLEAVLEVRDAYRDRIDVELVAFPQSGILASPGTAELMEEAVRQGCDLVGGLDPASFDRHIEGHLDVVFGIAERRGVGIDLHLHDGGTLGVFQIEQIAARTAALGMQGKVAVSHAYGLGDIDSTAQARVAERLARAGVAIMTNAPGAVSFPPIAILRAAGVTVFSGSDNIRDSWWPYGDGDMLRRANILGYRSGFYEDRQLEDVFDVVTAAGARAMGIADHAIAPGSRADFVTLAAQHIPEAVVAVPQPRQVYRAGRLVASDGVVVGAVS